MAAQKPGLARGTRDFGPVQMSRRNYLFSIIRAVFEKFGFQPLETPAIENLATLTGKYGDEGDQLLFKILNSGDYFEKAKAAFVDTYVAEFIRAFISAATSLDKKDESREALFYEVYLRNLEASKSRLELDADVKFFEKLIADVSLTVFKRLRHSPNFNIDLPFVEMEPFDDRIETVLPIFFPEIKSKVLTPLVSEKGLRYDLTVPFARYVVMNQHLHTFPFKRYQIQPVWRADRPQKGRYREFFQCDADVVGTRSLLCEAEIVLMIREVFEKLGLADYAIKLNNRKVLTGITEVIGAPGMEGPLCVAIDKLDKIGAEKVFDELKERGFAPSSVEALKPFLALSGDNETILNGLEKALAGSTTGLTGVLELREVLFKVAGSHVEVPQLVIDPTLARGLSYYTGCIFEVKPTSVQMGSICGGGRYDDLTGMFGLPDVSGVGISFGIDRIYDVLEELQLFPEAALQTTTVLIANFDDQSAFSALKVLAKLRAADIAAELYPEAAKLKKQFTYAESKGIPYLLMAGEAEFASGQFGLKDIRSGEQKTLTIDQIIDQLR